MALVNVGTHAARSGIRQLDGADPRHGPLPPLLLALTVVTGLVDAVSILQLGRVFVANMTGNVVFTGFAIAGAPGFSLSASLFALFGFLGGALIGGVLIGRLGHDRGLLLGGGAGLELVLVVAACVITAVGSTPFTSTIRNVTAALLAIGMAIQNAVAPPACHTGSDHHRPDHDPHRHRRRRPLRQQSDGNAAAARISSGDARRWRAWAALVLQTSAAVTPDRGVRSKCAE